MVKPPSLIDDPFPEEWDWVKVRDWFARRLVGCTLPETQLLAGRAALRSLPFLHLLLNIPSKTGTQRPESLLQSCLRCCPISAVAALVITAEIGQFRADAAVAARAASTAARATAAASDAAVAARAAAYAAASDAAVAARPATAFGARAVTAAARTAAAYAADIAAARATAAAFEQDCRIIEGGGVQALAHAKLWPSWDKEVTVAFVPVVPTGQGFSYTPQIFREELAQFESRLRNLADDFAVWAEWYHGILQGEKNGRYLFDLPTERALRLNVDIALIPDEFWKSPEKANAEIRRLVELARGEAKAPNSNTNPKSESSPKAKPKTARKPRASSLKPDISALKVEIDGYLTAFDKQLDEHLEIARANLNKITDMAARQPVRDEIERLENLKTIAASLKDAVARYAGGTAKKPEVEKQVGLLQAGIEDWWKIKHCDVLDGASHYSIKAVAICTVLGVSAAIGVAVGAPAIAIGAGAGMFAGKGLAKKAAKKAKDVLGE